MSTAGGASWRETLARADGEARAREERSKTRGLARWRRDFASRCRERVRGRRTVDGGARGRRQAWRAYGPEGTTTTRRKDVVGESESESECEEDDAWAREAEEAEERAARWAYTSAYVTSVANAFERALEAREARGMESARELPRLDPPASRLASTHRPPGCSSGGSLLHAAETAA